MGLVLSNPGGNSWVGESSAMAGGNSNKKMKMSSADSDNDLRLISNLPDEISMQILARLPRICHLKMKLVSRKWKAAIMSPELFMLRREFGTTEEWLCILTKVDVGRFCWHTFDPVSGMWQRLPPVPYVIPEEEPNRGLRGFRMWNVVGSSIKIADFIRGWLWRRDTIDQMPFCGCAVAVVDGCLYVLGGFSGSSAINSVWRYDPCLNQWQEVNSMTTARAFCKTGLLNNKLYVIGGVSRGRNGLIPLRSAEVFDPETGEWTELPIMPFLKAQVLPRAFLADLLKPIATGMATYRGKLCVPQSLYSWPFFFDIGGEMYDPEKRSWHEMPAGMGEGWPARQAGTKLAVVVDGDLYALDPSSSLDSGKIKRYDSDEDAWKVVIQNIPIRDFTDSESPYLLAGFLGKLHVITKDANNNVVIIEIKLQMPDESSSSTSSADSESSTAHNYVSLAGEGTEFWKVIAAKQFGASELVNCQVLNI